MNLKSIFQKLLLGFMNLLYYPAEVSYYWSNKPNRICIKNYRTKKFRWVGSPTWMNWNNEQSVLCHGVERLSPNMKEVSFKTLWYLFQSDSKIQSRIYFIDNLLLSSLVVFALGVTSKLFGWPFSEPFSISIGLLVVTAGAILSFPIHHLLYTQKPKEQK